MRRLTLLAVALAFALAGARLLTETGAATAAHVRDGGLLLAVGALIFALAGPPPAVRLPQAVSYRRPATARVLTGAGLLSATAAGLLFYGGPSGAVATSARVTLWLLGLLLLVLGVWWRGTVQRYSLPGYRWQKGADGAFTRVAIDHASLPERASAQVRLPYHRLWWAIIIGAGLLLRAWPLFTAPTSCVGHECAFALALVADAGATGPAHPFNPLFALAWLIERAVGNPLLSVRLAALLWGAAALALVWPLLRRLVSPAVAVAGVALAAFNPAHILAGHLADPWLPLPVALSAALWAVHRGQHTGSQRDWTAGGIALGVAVLTAPALAPGVLALALMAMLLGLTQRHHWIDTWRPAPLLFFAGALVATVLPVVFAGGPGAVDASGAGVPFPRVELTVALTALGVGLLLRYLRITEGATVLTALAALTVTALRTDAAPLAVALAITAPALVAVAFASDALLEALVASWQILVRPSRLAAGLFALLLAPMLWHGLTQSTAVDEMSIGQAGPTTRAMVDAASAALLDADAGAGDGARAPVLIYMPDAVLATAEARIGLGPWLAQERVLPLRVDAVLDGVDTAPRVFLTPAARGWSDVLRAYFPRSTEVPVFDEGAGTVLYHIVAVAPEPGDGPGLTATYTDGATAAPVATRTEADTAFDLGADLPDRLDATWRGSLRVPTAGSYRFDVTGLGPDDIFTLLIDGKLVLDTSLDRPLGLEVLAAGLHEFEARLRTEDKPATVTVRWAPPDQSPAPIPADALFTRALPALGLEATYFANADFQPPGVDLRRTLFFETGAADFPFSMTWQGKVAANRAGEYLFGVVADGRAEILLNGAQIASNQTLSGEGDAPGYAEGLAFLRAGWHDLEVRFAPAQPAAAITVLWQPPGSAPGALSPLYLRATEGALTITDAPLPPAPALTDPRLERDGFALTQGVELRQPQTVRLADNPPLLGLLTWESGGCGDGPTALAQPHGIAVDSARGIIYVADTGNARIARFTLDGTRMEAVTNPALQEPVDVALAPDGAIFVLDAAAQQVLQLDPATGTLTALTGTVSFYRPRGLTVTADGLLAVADTGGARVVVLDRNGNQVMEWGGPGTALGRGQPVDVAAAGATLWAVTSEDGRLWDPALGGSVIATRPAVSVDGPHLAALADGSFFLSDPAQATVHYHAAGGRPLRSFAYPGAFDKPTGIAALAAGNQIRLFAVDTARCTVSAWTLPAATLP